MFEGPHTSPSSPYHKSPKKFFRYLHCGDFRASPAHLLHPALKSKKVDICYLDTTYLNPRYCFPAQEQVVDACAELIKCRVEGDREALKRGSGGGAQLVRQGEMMKGWLSKAKKEEEEDDKSAIALADAKPAKPAERLLVMVGTYSIGKERIVKGIARAINAKIYCDQRKKEIFACQADPELMAMVTDDPLEGQIHVTWLGQIKVDILSDYLDKYKPHFTSIVGLRPTGWTFKPEGNMALTLKNPSVLQMISRELQRSYNPSWMTPTKDSTRTVEAYGVPYSEHSSFAELVSLVHDDILLRSLTFLLFFRPALRFLWTACASSQRSMSVRRNRGRPWRSGSISGRARGSGERLLENQAWFHIGRCSIGS